MLIEHKGERKEISPKDRMLLASFRATYETQHKLSKKLRQENTKLERQLNKLVKKLNANREKLHEIEHAAWSLREHLDALAAPAPF